MQPAVFGELDLVAGVDTHKDTLAAALCEVTGRVVAQVEVPADGRGYARLLDWALEAAGGRRVAWAVEGTRHYGLGLARHLAAAGQRVHEIEGTRHIGKRRAGKSDPIDAIRAARDLVARPRPATPRADGHREILRLLMIDRDHAVACAKTARTILASIIVTAPEPVRAQLRGLTPARRITACAAVAAPPGAGPLTTATIATLNRLGCQVTDLNRTARTLKTQITATITTLAPGLLDEPGVGPVTAAQIILAWSHPGRIHSEAAFAMLAGTAPIPASSGTTSRHRLNRGGDRQLNKALHTIAINRMRHHQPTRDYTTRRHAEGKTTPEIRRCIKRYLTRHLYRTLSNLYQPLDNT
jgi:transposase